MYRPVVTHKRVTVSMASPGLDSHSKKSNIYYFHYFPLVWRQAAALSSATKLAMSPEFIGR